MAVAVNPITLQPQFTQNNIVPASPGSVKNEFATMFYKELLKQSFSGEFMGMENGALTDMAREVFIEKLASELAEKNSSILPDSLIKGKGIVGD